MKLKSIEIDHYKNLHTGFPFERSNGYISLIGLNGSGKSNLLEAISLLFAHIMGIDLDFPFSQYALTYDIRNHGVDITEGDSLENGAITKEDLPSSVFACYSGEDNRLWESGFRKYYVEFFNAAIKGADYKPQLLYINKYCWKIAFISLLYSEHEDVRSFINEKLHINIDSVRIRFATKDGANPQQHDASNWYSRVQSKYQDSDITINDLKGDDEIDLRYEKYPELTPDQAIFYYLYFLHMPDKKGTLGLEADKVIDRIEINVNGYSFENLSEGEKKLILIECITKVLGDENSLVLLDEPDAHTHIAMKKELLKLISEFDGQTVMTTHSPVFVDMIPYSNLTYIDKGHPVDMNKIQMIKEVADNQISVLESALISSSKKLLITEGPGDVIHLEKVIEVLANKYDKYKPLLDDVAIVFQGGAKMVEEYYHSVLSGMYDSIDKAVFAFDHDSEGREGAKLVEGLDKEKVDYVFYEKNYPITSTELDFYLEDFYPSSFYNDVVLPSVQGKPSYRQMKKMNSLADSVKRKINKNIKQDDIDSSIFEDFKNFLDQLLRKFGYA